MEIDDILYCSHCMKIITREPCPYCGHTSDTISDCYVLEQGTLLNKRYQLGAVIGKGGFGITYAAFDEVLNKPVAIKEFFPYDFVTRNVCESDAVVLPVDPDKKRYFTESLLKFKRESRILVTLDDVENIVTVTDQFDENETAYYVMEFIYGQTIDSFTAGKSTQEILEIIRPIFDAMVKVHAQGIIHRDIKPDNIMVDETGTPILIDFGTAADAASTLGTIVLTRKYAPIEQYGREYGSQGPWSDVYGMGALMYRLLSGEEPVESISRKQNDTMWYKRLPVTRREEKALKKALMVDSDNRTQSLAEFRARLYGLPLPDEVIMRKRFMRRIVSLMVFILTVIALVIVNFSIGFPIRMGMRLSLNPNGWHVVKWTGTEEKVELPSTIFHIPISSIKDRAFSGASNLKCITIPASIRSIGDGTFANCENLYEVHFENDGMIVGDGCFDKTPEILAIWGTGEEFKSKTDGYHLVNRDAFSFEAIDGGLKVTRVKVEGDESFIPSYVDGIPVIEISESPWEFDGNSWIREIWFPEHLTRIPDELCYGKGVSEIHFGNHLVEIGKDAFSSNWPLETVTFPDSLKRIGDYAFCDCGLEEIRLPDRMESIGKGAFCDNRDLKVVQLPDGVELGINCFSGDESLEEIELPAELHSIPAGLFSGTGIRQIRIPDHVEKIGFGAFRGTNLEYVILPACVRQVESAAFSQNYNLKWVEILNDEIEIEDFENTFSLCVMDLCFGGRKDSSLERYAEAVGAIFEDVDGWNREMILNGSRAGFDEDTVGHLGEIRVPWFNEKENCPITETYGLFLVSSESVVLPRFQTVIPEFAFDSCTSLVSVKSAGSIHEIRAQAFNKCVSLQEVELGNQVYFLGDCALSSCNQLENLSLLKGTWSIAEFAFADCTGLTSIEIPGSVKTVGAYAFEGCTNAECAVLEEGVRHVGHCVFQNCTGLKTVVLPRTLNEVPAFLFNECESLSDVWFYNEHILIDDLCLAKLFEGEFYDRYEPERADRLVLKPRIHGYPVSTAYEFATRNGYEFVPIDEMRDEKVTDQIFKEEN